MILTAKGLLNEKPTPSEEDVLRAISGNLCRCTGYYKIKKAIMRVADENRNKFENESQQIGK
jgi:carbon-monoxide dehydrogenase small subunit